LNHLERFSAGFLTFGGGKVEMWAEIAPSVIAYGDATFPKGTAFGGGGKVSRCL
jgi:hypothetical protein